MIEEKTTKIIKCDLCSRILDDKLKRKVPFITRLLELFLWRQDIDLCEDCFDDCKIFIEEHRKLK